MKIYKYIGIMLLSLASALSAEVLVQYDFEGEVLSASAVHANITAADFAANGDGSTNFLVGDGSSKSYSKDHWDAADDYFSFAVTVEDGYIVDLDSLVFAAERSSSGPTNWTVKYSEDGSVFYDMESGEEGASGTFHDHTADLLVPFDLTGTVYFRVYATNASGPTGTWRVDDVTLNGTISVDTGRRVLKYQGFDSLSNDDWGYVTNAGTAVVGIDSTKYYHGSCSMRMAGSADGSANHLIMSISAVHPVCSFQLRLRLLIQHLITIFCWIYPMMMAEAGVRRLH